ncbi:MAG TPA: ribosome small subunit-dependent GTPase A [Gammaproteobacteria bacterium]|nr:ribosome small subunit-dependent GTPase A [Gammaproteobacteria bacterium]|tara:strand:+ start:166 stop:1266 length:1101 start_codon:yes stop_codon:yes gene_type:complete
MTESHKELPQPASVEALGWRGFFDNQVTEEERSECTPARVIAVHRDALVVHDGNQELRLQLGRQWSKTTSHERPTTGDWLLLDSNREWISRMLSRESVIKRVSAGVDAGQQTQEQAIAANVDTIFVVTSANDEFSESRLERYLALAHNAGIEPVVVVTKCDLTHKADDFRNRTLALTDVPVTLVNALDESTVHDLYPWLASGNTVAMMGSSGVGKSTLLNTLAGVDIQDTGDVRDNDKRGRHTTTSRSIHLLGNGALMLDTPGIRELTFAFGQETLSEMFQDIEDLIPQCKFSDCAHESEPGCAINAAIDADKLDRRRFENYQKMLEEESEHTQTIDENRLEKRRYKNQKMEPGPRDSKKKRKRRI